MEIIQVIQKGNEIIIKKEDFEKLLSELESLIETVEILSDKELLKKIEEGLEDIKKREIKGEEELWKLLK